MKKILTTILLLMSSTCFSEYRVYQYSLTNKISTAKDQPNFQVVLSTLDPVSYIAYNGGSQLVEVDLLRTWICPGHTGQGKDICDNPYGKLPEGLQL